jgi:hypothetical protein
MSDQVNLAEGSEQFHKVKEYLAELGYAIVSEDPEEEIMVINDEEASIANMILDCEETILIIEQVIFKLNQGNEQLYKRLLQLNRDFIHGAFVLDDEGGLVIYRDTIQLENLDLNELEASINSLGLFLAEHSAEIIEMAKS